MARTIRARRVGRIRSADHVEHAREHRVERGASRPGLLVSDRLGRSDLRDVTGGPLAHERRIASACWPATTPRWSSREKPIGGRRDEPAAARRAGLPRRRILQPGRRPPPLGIPLSRRGGRSPISTKSTTSRRPTPVTDGQRLFVWFGTGQIAALDLRGAVVWAKHLGEEYSPFDINWGHGSSPVLYKDLLILLCDHESASYLLALDARTGTLRWKADRGKGRASYSTPLVVPGPNGDELLVNSSERIDGYDPATGERLWYADAPRQTPVPSAVFHDGLVYMTRGYRNSPYLALRPGGRGDVSAATSSGGRLAAARTRRRSSTTKGCSISPTTSAS